MKYNDLMQLFFERSNALTWYWSLYVIVIGGLVAFASFRQRQNLAKTVLVTVLFICFAYKNIDAIHDVTVQRFATLKLLQESSPTASDAADVKQVRDVLEPTLVRATPEFEGVLGVRNFHVFCTLLTIITLWVMEYHRKKED